MTNISNIDNQSNKIETTQFEEVRGIIDLHRTRVASSVNEEALLTYWNVGKYLSNKLQTQEWGSLVVNRLAEYLRVVDPSLKGYGRRNLYNMVMFYESYSSSSFLELINRIANKSNEDSELYPVFVQNDSAQMPKILTLTIISNHIEILSRCKTAEERLFYILYTYRERLKYKELKRCIDNDSYGAIVGGDKSNMSQMLKRQYPMSPMMLRDTVYIDLLGLPKKINENQLRKAMVDKMREFILDLGKDFIFMEQEYRLPVGSSVFKCDLLFFHRGLQCLVAVELKTGKFHPKDLGQLEFYLEALDRDVKRSNENPSIGILLCREADSVQVEYAMSRSMSPTMIAEYKRLLIPREVMQSHLDEYAQLVQSKR